MNFFRNSNKKTPAQVMSRSFVKSAYFFFDLEVDARFVVFLAAVLRAGCFFCMRNLLIMVWEPKPLHVGTRAQFKGHLSISQIIITLSIKNLLYFKKIRFIEPQRFRQLITSCAVSIHSVW